jgi:uncharacterized protein YcbK (DUF882 family)
MKPLSRSTDAPLGLCRGPGPGRRQILASLGGLLAGCAAPAVHARAELGWSQGSDPLGQAGQGAQAAQAPLTFWERPRWVWLRRAATGEQVRVVYWRDGQLLQEPYRQICWLLRDVRFERMTQTGHPVIRRALDAGVVRPSELHFAVEIDARVMDLLYAYSAWLASFEIRRPLEITSGFRHVITNDYMTEGAVRGSLHVQGKAVDLALPGVDVARLGSFGAWVGGGGVGIYPTRNFIHLDAGRVRSWTS